MDIDNQNQNQNQEKEQGMWCCPGKVLTFVVLVAFFVVLVLTLVVTRDAGPDSVDPANTPSRGEMVEEIAPGQEKRTAEEGDLVRGFPQQLLLEEGIDIDESFSINYEDEEANQPVVTYRSQLSLVENVTLFGDYLQAGNWNIIQDAELEEGSNVTNFYAINDMADVNVTFVVGTQGEVDVTIAYLEK